MNNFEKLNMMNLIKRYLTVMLAACMALVLVGCGGGGVVPSNGVQIRALSADFGARTRSIEAGRVAMQALLPTLKAKMADFEMGR